MLGTDGGLRTRRPLVLLLAAAAIVATLVAPVAAGNSPTAAPALTTSTRSASCAGPSFYPLNSGDGYGTVGTLRYLANLAGAYGYFACDPGLPNGAVVTKVQFTVRDAYSSGDVTECELVRAGLTPATAASSQVMAGPLSTSGTPDVLRLTDSTIDFATVNDTKYGYWLQCRLGGSDLGLGIYGANVIYTISAANG